MSCMTDWLFLYYSASTVGFIVTVLIANAGQGFMTHDGRTTRNTS